MLILADGENAVFDRDIFAGEDEMDAGMRQGAREIDAANARVRMRGAEELAVEHAGENDVVGKAGLAGDFGAGVDAAAGFADDTEIFGIGRGVAFGRVGRIFRFGHRQFLGSLGCAAGGNSEDGGFDGFEDLQIAGAAAEIAGERFADLIAGGMGILVEERFGGEQNAGSAVAALRCAEISEGFLQRVKLAFGAEAFDGEDASVGAFYCELKAGEDGLAVKEDGAGATFAEFAAVLGAGVAEIFAEDFEESFVGSERDVDFFAIESEAKVKGLFRFSR